MRREGGELSTMNGLLGDLFAFLADPASWVGPEGILSRLAEHIGLSVLAVVIAVAVYLPSMIRGERLLPDHSGGEAQWIGGPRQGAAELPAPDGDDSRAGGASGQW